MRFALFIVILAVALLIVALATGLLHFRSAATSAASNDAAVPSRSFDVETGSVHVGSRPATVKVPRLEVRPPASAPANDTANSAERH